MPSPSLCGSFLSDKRALVAFTWTITCVLTLVAFILSTVFAVHQHTQYQRLERYYEQQWQYNQYNNQEDNHDGGGQDEMDRLLQLSRVTSRSMSFVAVYIMMLAMAFSLYGSTAIVGFTSLQGVYIAPCFSYTNTRLKLGMFGGAVVLFANLLLVCAVIFGEVRVEDWKRRDANDETYEVEKIATILAVACMFLSSLYIIFALLLFLYFGNQPEEEELLDASSPMHHASTELIDPRREAFITISGDSASTHE